MKKNFIFVANWKMNKTARLAVHFLDELLQSLEETSSKIYIAPSFTCIHSLSLKAKGTFVVVGAQNMNDAKEGALTEEVSALMLKEAGAEFVILGHSERRTLFSETSDMIHKKLVRALQDDIEPICCVGELLNEDLGAVKLQLWSLLSSIPKEMAHKIKIAYEPIWAIGTGKVASSEHILEAHKMIRNLLIDTFGKEAGTNISILYGGSVKVENILEISKLKNVDGVLVGGASLNAKTFAEMIQIVERK